MCCDAARNNDEISPRIRTGVIICSAAATTPMMVLEKAAGLIATSGKQIQGDVDDAPVAPVTAKARLSPTDTR